MNKDFVDAMQNAWAAMFGHQSAADAFGTAVFFSEADLDRSAQIQRERRMCGAHLDFRKSKSDTFGTKVVRLNGGPYDGRTALVNEHQNSAWVVGDYSYEAPRHVKDADQPWTWFYDEFA